MDQERRDLLKGSVAVGTVAVVGGIELLLPQSAQASPIEKPSLLTSQRNPELVYKPTQVRSSRFWWTLNDRIAELRGIPTLHAPGWIFWKHDDLHQKIFGTNPHTYEWGQEKSKLVMYSNDPEYVATRESAGFCNGSIAAALLEGDPGHSRIFYGEWYDRAYLEGFLAADYISSLMYPIGTTRESIEHAVSNDMPLMIEWPADWYRGVNWANGGVIGVTAYGNPDIPVEINQINAAYIVRRNDGTRNATPEILADAERRRIPGWNPQITRMLLDAPAA